MAKKPARESPPHPRKVFLLADKGAFTASLIRKVNREKDITVCGKANDLKDAITAIPRLCPDLVIVSIAFRGERELGRIKKLRAKRSPSEFRVLVLSPHADPGFAKHALRAGADGYILSHEPLEEIVCAIRDLLAGHMYVSERVMAERSAKLRPTGANRARARNRLAVRKERKRSQQASNPDWKTFMIM